MDRASGVALRRPTERRGGRSSLRALFLLLLLAALAIAVPSESRAPAGSPARPAAKPAPTSTGAPLLPATDLIYRVPAKFRPGCVPLNTGNSPVEVLDCTEGLTRATYARFADVAAMEAQFDAIVSAFNLPSMAGGCRAGIHSHDMWHYTHSRGRAEGRMACFIMPPDVPVIAVTQPEQRLFAMVVSNPSVGWGDHFEAWSVRVPNPPPDRQRPRRATPPAP